MAAQDLAPTGPRQNLVDQVPGLRQLLLLVGLAAAVALGVWVVLWSQEDSYRVLFSNLGDRDALEIVQVLEAAGVPNRYESGAGAVLVPADQVHTARLQLASQDLPSSGGVGFEMLNESNGISDSQFVENARFKRALEVELQRTIASISAVTGARVHLAVPRQTVFLRDRQPASASVLVNLYPGRRLEPGQVASVVNLVAASVPEMERGQVTVIDQNGTLLTQDPDAEEPSGADALEEQAERMEERLTSRVEELLAPIVGLDNVRAQVAVSLNPERREETQELYDPDTPVIRSEELSEEPAFGAGGGQGVPGALSNQPPVAAGAEPGEEDADPGDPALATRSLRNYEISRTVRYLQAPVGSVRRLNVAVVLNERSVLDAEGEPETVAYTPEELERFTELVRKAVGFEEARGDAVSVVGATFIPDDDGDVLEVEEPSFLDRFDLVGALRVIAALVVVLVLVLMIIRPTLRQLLTIPAPRTQMLPQSYAQGLPAGADGEAGAGALPGGRQEDARDPKVDAASEFDQRVASAKEIVRQDPKRVAQVVNDWVNQGEA